MASIRDNVFPKGEKEKRSLPKGSFMLLFIALTALLAGAVYHTAAYKGPLGTLSQWYAQPGNPRGKYEIVYYGLRKCRKCREWRQHHLPEFRQTDLARHVRINTRSAKCRSNAIGGSGSIYVRTCNALFGGHPGEERLAFALIDRRAKKVLKTGRGIEGFYRVLESVEWQIAHFTPAGNDALVPASAATLPSFDEANGRPQSGDQ